mmetsp:Transcript_27310/g.35361  ORF Transcript_27310/g.35361 Transcript_27310/m.35361 type:complete len:213 (+) Transcript_27310:218-856(+)
MEKNARKRLREEEAIKNQDWYVDLKNGKDSNRGTKKSPFLTLDKAEEMIEKFRKIHPYHARSLDDNEPSVTVICHPDTCELKTCNISGCNGYVCTEHGDGNGESKTTDDNENYLSFENKLMCSHNECTFALCQKHNESRLNALLSCDVCENGARAEGLCDGMKLFCSTHLTTCHGKYVDEYEDDETEKECGFRCCCECLDSHQCGYDPSESV